MALNALHEVVSTSGLKQPNSLSARRCEINSAIYPYSSLGMYPEKFSSVNSEKYLFHNGGVNNHRVFLECMMRV